MKDKTTPQEYARMKDEYANEQYLQDKKIKAHEEGKQEGKRQALIKLLTLKFPQMPVGIIERIEETKDIQVLDDWFNQAVLAQKIEEVGL